MLTCYYYSFGDTSYTHIIYVDDNNHNNNNVILRCSDRNVIIYVSNYIHLLCRDLRFMYPKIANVQFSKRTEETYAKINKNCWATKVFI